MLKETVRRFVTVHGFLLHPLVLSEPLRYSEISKRLQTITAIRSHLRLWIPSISSYKYNNYEIDLRHVKELSSIVKTRPLSRFLFHRVFSRT